MKYSIHDGPGIRTTVFLKGCPLNCWWCHNPESIAPGQQLMIRADRCIACGACLAACPHGAVTEAFGTDKAKCQICLACVNACHAEARLAVARTVTVEQVLAEVAKDAIFYEESGGGVTFSGGEPLLQPEFLCRLLALCKAKEIHTAVDTTGFAKWPDLMRVSTCTDLFLYDLKLMDEAAHRKYTGVSNETILRNLQDLSRLHHNIIVRIPVIPGVNDCEENLVATGEFVAGLGGVREINLLPYHKAGVTKYQRMGKPYELPEAEPPSAATMQGLADTLRAFGKRVTIGGQA
ncbi:MAG TPA: glycyl-radical enzyme activating protein [Symbiobacteriaceae bacterium]|nr:glycyl-radical enzyme activating protein [Symbiobacteriaceae bacterium]